MHSEVIQKPLFRVSKEIVPEWGSRRVEWVKYFLASDLETIKSWVHYHYGKPCYYRYDEESVEYDFQIVPVQEVFANRYAEEEY